MKFSLRPAFFAANCEHSKQEREDLEESKGYLVDSPLKETFSFVEVMKRMNRARWSVPLNVCHAPDLPQFSDSL